MGEINFLDKLDDKERIVPLKKAASSAASVPVPAAAPSLTSTAKIPAKDTVTKKSSAQVASKNEQGDKLPAGRTKTEHASFLAWFKRIFDGPEKKAEIAAPLPAISAIGALSGSAGVKEADKPAPAAGKTFSGMIEAPSKMTSVQTAREDNPLLFSKSSWSGKGVMSTNLIDKSDYSFFDTSKKVYGMLAAVFAALFFGIVLYGAVMAYEHFMLRELDDEKENLAAMEQGLSGLEADVAEAKRFQSSLDRAGEILENHVYMTRFFRFLEENTLSNLRYSGVIEHTVGQALLLQGRVPSFLDLRNQLMIFAESPYVKELDLKSAKYYEESSGEAVTSLLSSTTPLMVEKRDSGIEFEIELVLDESLYSKPLADKKDKK